MGEEVWEEKEAKRSDKQDQAAAGFFMGYGRVQKAGAWKLDHCAGVLLL